MVLHPMRSCHIREYEITSQATPRNHLWHTDKTY